MKRKHAESMAWVHITQHVDSKVLWTKSSRTPTPLAACEIWGRNAVNAMEEEQFEQFDEKRSKMIEDEDIEDFKDQIEVIEV